MLEVAWMFGMVCNLVCFLIDGLASGLVIEWLVDNLMVLVNWLVG